MPTYNEAENLEAILRAALEQLASTGREHTVLVVDDGSPDGTGQIADRLAVSSDLIYLVWRHKLWWMVPLLVAMVVLAALVVIEATPIGPLLYPVF